MKKLILGLFILTCGYTYNVSAAEPVIPETAAKQAYMIDFETGAVLLEKNASEKMPTSSMSKVMTMYMVFDALKSGKMKLEDTLVVSERAWKMQYNKSSVMFVKLNDAVKLEDLIRGVVVQSGNDATIVLAEGLAGSEEAFAEAMNKKAGEIGMADSHFMNSSGFPDDNHYSTAHDLAIMAKAMIASFPEYYHYYSEKEFTYNGIKQGNRNPLLYKDIGADGMKTGHTEAAGYGLIGTGVKDGRRVIMVLNGMASMKERASESVRLLQWGLSGFKNVSLFKEDIIVDKARVVMGEKTEVALTYGKNPRYTLPKLGKINPSVEVKYNAPLKAPIVKGTEVGTITVTFPDKSVQEIPLITAEDVPELSGFVKLIMKARMITTGANG